MFKNVTLELSLKPFKKTGSEYIKSVCKKIFDDWRPLIKNCDTISVMLWTADGSEILDYSGDLTDSFEWCKYLGTANNPLISNSDPHEISLHIKKQLYIKNPPIMTYKILKEIVSALRGEASRRYPDAKIEIGETFDIGPEFALSDFKYNRHTEICTGTKLDKCGFIDSTALLHADTRKYASYPDGIPEGTPFGTFLGKQSEVFLKDLGFDYLWLSNGLGFSAEPWSLTGKIFDGENYYPERLSETKERVFDFWRLFRKECSYPLRTRGTNNSVGIDYASDGVPLYDIYNAGLDISPPPNSPWAALNDNYGLEIMGHMTRICELPSDMFLFRYYIHDPWWMNSPWYDRYGGFANDIYLPMSVSRIASDGKVQTAEALNILSIDNSRGDMPEACVNEPIPHLLKAKKDAPDAVCPAVWVYPMREFTTATDGEWLREMNEGDRFICESINNGLALNCVVSTDNFLKTSLEIYKSSVLISPIPMNNDILERLNEFAKIGKVIVYGSARLLENLKTDESVIKVAFSDGYSAMRLALGKCGYEIDFNARENVIKLPALTVSRSACGWFFSVYNPDTTTDTKLKFPLGAPILIGGEAEIKDGMSTYRFQRSEHRECRIFVKQESGVISCHEACTANARYRRRIRIHGLENATIYYFPEPDNAKSAIACDPSCQFDGTPIKDDRFKIVHNETFGTCLVGENISGDVHFLAEFKERIN